MENYNIDEIDAEIIAALDEDVRSTYTALAKRISVEVPVLLSITPFGLFLPL